MMNTINVKYSKPFRPGNKPSLDYCGEQLNAKVAWKQVLKDLFKNGMDKLSIKQYSGINEKILIAISLNEYDRLSFKQGARLLSLHSQFYPEYY